MAQDTVSPEQQQQPQRAAAEQVEQQQQQAEAAQEQQVQLEELPPQYQLTIIVPPRPTHSEPALQANGKSRKGAPAAAALSEPRKISILTLPNETFLDLRQAVHESPDGHWIGAFSFRDVNAEGTGPAKEKLSDFVEVADVLGKQERADKVLYVVLENYTDIEARHHVIRFRESAFGPAPYDPNGLGVEAGLSILDYIHPPPPPDATAQPEEAAAAAPEPETKSVAAKGKGKGKKAAPEHEPEPEPESTEPAPAPANHAFSGWKSWTSRPLSTTLPKERGRELKTSLRSLALSAWNPPPPPLRLKGHLHYLVLSTLEGETYHVTSSTRGFFVNRSTSQTFDPSPRADIPAGQLTHSLFDLVARLSPLFVVRFSPTFSDALDPPRDPFSIVPVPQAIPARPWLVTTPSHNADAIRTQTAYLLTGPTSLESLEGARDWNDELQSIRESPRDTYQERLLRERLFAKIYADFALAAVRGVMSIVRGEIQPLNPAEDSKTFLYLHANIFYSPSSDASNQIFTHLGGDEAAHVSVGKDIAGIRMLNSLDLPGLALLASVVVDYAGERWFAQSVIPGLLRRHEVEAALEAKAKKAAVAKSEANVDASKAEEENGEKETEEEKEDEEEEKAKEKLINQVIYGSVEGPEEIRTDKRFGEFAEEIARAYHLAQHPVKDANGKAHELWTSVELKGLHGGDGRRYALETARLNPMDVLFLETDLEGRLYDDKLGPESAAVTKASEAAAEGEEKENAEEAQNDPTAPAKATEEDLEAVKAAGKAHPYPHKFLLLRPEAVEAWVETESKTRARKAVEEAKAAGIASGLFEAPREAVEAKDGEEAKPAVPGPSSADVERAINEGKLSLPKLEPVLLNPDAFVPLPLPKEGEKQTSAGETTADESDPAVKAVRDASNFVRNTLIPILILDVIQGSVSPADGAALTFALHQRGINMRYLGLVYYSANSQRHRGSLLGPARGSIDAFKTVVLQEMVFRASKRILRSLLSGAPQTHLQPAISHFLNCLLGTSIEPRPTAVLPDDFEEGEPTPAWAELTPESLRERITTEVARRFRFQLAADYFEKQTKKPQLLREIALRVGVQLELRDYRFDESSAVAAVSEDEDRAASPANGVSKKKTKKQKRAEAAEAKARSTTFIPDDIVSIVPLVKDSAPKSALAEETYEHGRAAIQQGQRDVGVELMFEGVNLFEQIYTPLHAEVARAFNGYVVARHNVLRMTAAPADETPEAATEREASERVEMEQCLRLARNAVVIAERTLGVDHNETLSYVHNLAFLEATAGNVEVALKYFRYAFELWDTVYGPGHPECFHLFQTVASILQGTRRYQDALQLFLAARDAALELYGPQAFITAALLQKVAESYITVNDLKSAVVAAKESWSGFVDALGKDSAEAKEAEAFLGNLTKAAVQVAKSHQDLIARQTRQNALRARNPKYPTSLAGRSAAAKSAGVFPPSTAAAAAAAAESAPASAQTSESVIRGDEDVDALVKYIQGTTARVGGKKAVRANGKKLSRK